jgi:transcriptional regulator with XRE-family HTH domain
MPNLNRALKQIRLFHNLNQSKCAEKLGVTQVVVSKIESGDSVSFSLLTRYAETFQIPEWQILFFSENMLSDENEKSTKFRNFVSDKVLRILEFISKNTEIEILRLKLLNCFHTLLKFPQEIYQ